VSVGVTTGLFSIVITLEKTARVTNCLLRFLNGKVVATVFKVSDLGNVPTVFEYSFAGKETIPQSKENTGSGRLERQIPVGIFFENLPFHIKRSFRTGIYCSVPHRRDDG